MSETTIPQIAPPQGWVSTTLKAVCEMYQPKTISKKEMVEGGKFPVFGANGIIGTYDQYNHEEPKVLVTCRGATCGTINVSKPYSWINGNAMVIDPNARLIDFSFLIYLLEGGVKLQDAITGTAQPQITRNSLEPLILALPPLNEQKRIVAKIEELFSELDAGVSSLKQARTQLGIYRQALLKQAFEGKLTAQWRRDHPDQLESPEKLLTRIQQERETRYQTNLQTWQTALEEWEANGKEGKKLTKPRSLQDPQLFSTEEANELPAIPNSWCFLRLDAIAQIGTGMSVSRNRTFTDPTEVPYLRVANVQRGELKLDEIKTMKIEKNRLQDLKICHNDLLFNEGGDIDKLGRGWVWKSQVENCVTQNHVFRGNLYSKDLTVPEFVSHWANAFGQDFFFKGGKQTTNLASISKSTLSSLPVPVPPGSEQIEILRLLEEQFTAIEQNEREIDASLQRAEALRQSILKRAFSGQLVEQDPSDEPATELLKRIQQERSEREAQAPKKPKKKAAKRARKKAKK